MVDSNDVLRLFLQAILSRSVVSEELAKALWNKSVDAVKAVDPDLHVSHTKTKADWDECMVKIKHPLDPLDLDFTLHFDEVTGKHMYALVNRKGGEIAQMATHYSPLEIIYFKAVVEQIMLAPRMAYSVSSLVALREVGNLKSKTKTTMSKGHAEHILGTFVASGWLLKSQRGRYSLGPRTVLELFDYLKGEYPDEILECTICDQLVTRGVACLTPNCKCVLHTHCFNQHRRHKSICPACQQDWSADKKLRPVGEGAVRDGQDDGQRRVVRKRGESGEASDEETNEEEEEDGNPTQSQSMEVDDDEDDSQPARPARRSGR